MRDQIRPLVHIVDVANRSHRDGRIQFAAGGVQLPQKEMLKYLTAGDAEQKTQSTRCVVLAGVAAVARQQGRFNSDVVQCEVNVVQVVGGYDVRRILSDTVELIMPL